MPETIEDIIAKLPSDADILKRMINGLRRRKPFPTSRAMQPDPLWSRVSSLSGHGCGYSTAICIKFGFDPDEVWRPEK